MNDLCEISAARRSTASCSGVALRPRRAGRDVRRAKDVGVATITSTDLLAYMSMTNNEFLSFILLNELFGILSKLKLLR